MGYADLKASRTAQPKTEEQAKNNNLTHCLDCHGLVSKSAFICPHCGAKACSREQKRVLKIAAIWILSCIVISSICVIFNVLEDIKYDEEKWRIQLGPYPKHFKINQQEEFVKERSDWLMKKYGNYGNITPDSARQEATQMWRKYWSED